MNIKFYSHVTHCEFTDAMKDAVTREMSALEKFCDEDEPAKVTINEEGNQLIISAQIVTLSNKRLRANVTSESHEFYSALKTLVNALYAQANKAKNKYKKKFVKELEEVAEDPSQIARYKTIYAESMSAEHAIELMNNLGHTFFVFLDRDNRDAMSAVYVRHEGDYGLMELRDER